MSHVHAGRYLGIIFSWKQKVSQATKSAWWLLWGSPNFGAGYCTSNQRHLKIAWYRCDFCFLLSSNIHFWTEISPPSVNTQTSSQGTGEMLYFPITKHPAVIFKNAAQHTWVWHLNLGIFSEFGYFFSPPLSSILFLLSSPHKHLQISASLSSDSACLFTKIEAFSVFLAHFCTQFVMLWYSSS